MGATPLSESGLLTRHPWVQRWSLTVSEYHRMGEAGILTEDDRVELIEGELIAMTPIGSAHAGSVIKLTRVLVRAAQDRATVSPQNPVRLDDHSEPQPDLAVLNSRADDYVSTLPGPENILLLIEIADSSLRYDRSIKRPLYARHGIPELWIIDLTARTIEVCRRPDGGDYQDVRHIGRDGTLDITTLPGISISAADILG